MASDANWLLGAPGGGETGGCCISATLRDYARLGLFVLTGGTLPDGEQVLPTNWITESITPSAAFAGYGYFWWLAGDGRYSAQGIFGQHIFIDPAQNLVIAVHSNEETAVYSLHAQHLVAVIERLSKAPLQPHGLIPALGSRPPRSTGHPWANPSTESFGNRVRTRTSAVDKTPSIAHRSPLRP